MALPNGSIQVSALNVTDLPPENHDDVVTVAHSPPKRRVRRKIGQQHTEDGESNRGKKDDGSVIDVMCIYTRQALCQEAVGADYCNMTMYRRVMDDKCALAIAETVRATIFNGDNVLLLFF